MNYILEKRDNLVIFTINNLRMEGEVSSQFKAEFLIFCQPDLQAFIVDLHNVEFIDSAGLGALLLAYRQLKDNNIPVVLVGTNDYIKSMMSISQIDGLFDFFDNMVDTLKEYQI